MTIGFNALCAQSTSAILETVRERQAELLDLPEPIVYNPSDDVIRGRRLTDDEILGLFEAYSILKD